MPACSRRLCWTPACTPWYRRSRSATAATPTIAASRATRATWRSTCTWRSSTRRRRRGARARMTGRELSHFRILEPIGQGGMGVVYRGVDLRLDRPVAIKLLPSGVGADPARRQRFEREARAASALNHPDAIAGRRYVSAYSLASVHAALGDTERALGLLERAYEQRDWSLAFLAVDPAMDSLASQARFQKLVRRLGLEPATAVSGKVS